MPVRKIKMNHRSLTGKVASLKNDTQVQFESSLERDLIYHLEFDYNIKNYEEQPFTLEYLHNNSQRKYTPDFIVHYRNDIEPASSFGTFIYEVKYREEIKSNWNKLKPKFRAMINHCSTQGWKFKILTEKEIRIDYLENAKFLLPFKNIEVDLGMNEILLERLNKSSLATPGKLIKSLSKQKTKQAEFLHSLWYLVANHYIETDLSKRVTMNSEIWTPSPNN